MLNLAGLEIKKQKSRGTREQLKIWEAMEVSYICRYTVWHLLLIQSTYITMTELGIKCPSVYLQV